MSLYYNKKWGCYVSLIKTFFILGFNLEQKKKKISQHLYRKFDFRCLYSEAKVADFTPRVERTF